MLTRRQFITWLPVVSASPGAFGRDAGSDEAARVEAWGEIREQLFGDRKITEKQEYISLLSPYRPDDGAAVPIEILSKYPQNSSEFIRKHWLIIDENPSPVGAVFEFTPQSGTANVWTRIRVNAYSCVRVVSETNEGDLFMTANYVKASGGCSAPPQKTDPELAALTIGKMELEYGDMRLNQPGRIHLAINHPNFSGLQMNQVTLLFIPPQFIQEIDLHDSSGNHFFRVESDISLSTNPSIDFTYVPSSPQVEMYASVLDSKGTEYTSQWQLTASA